MDDLTAHGALVPGEMVPQRSLELWIERGWRDALDFHLSTKDNEFFTGDDREQEKKLIREQLSDGSEPIESVYKEYPAESSIELPQSRMRIDAASFGETIHRRRTSRRHNGKAISLGAFSELLLHSFGKTRETPSPLGPYVGRTSPSGGMLHPTETYVSVHRVDGLAPGLYHYSVRSHALSLIREGDFEDQLFEVGHRQSGLKGVSATFLLTTRWQRHIWKYRYARSYRSTLYDVGHLVQTHLFVATALRMRTFLTPAIRDTMALELFKLPDYLTESPMYLTAVSPE